MDNEDYYEYGPSTYMCMNCLGKLECVGCKARGNDLLICDACPGSSKVTSNSCLKCEGLSVPPDGPWFCSHCSQQQRQPSKRAKPAEDVDREIGRRYRRWLTEVRQLEDAKKALAKPVDTTQLLKNVHVLRSRDLDNVQNLRLLMDACSALIEAKQSVHAYEGRLKEVRELEQSVDVLKRELDETVQ